MKQAHRCGEFFGNPTRSHQGGGIVLSHRIAAGDVEPHVHDDAHLVWVTGGRYVSSAAGEADKRPVFIYNPAGTSHCDHFQNGKGSFFAILLRSRFLEHSCGLPAQATHIANPRARGRALELMYEFWNAPDSPLLVEGLCTELVAALAAVQQDRRPPDWLSRARDVLHDRAADNLSLTAVASDIGVHPIHFTRTFRNFFGCTPGVYLRHCRLRRAADLLRRSDMALSEIALAAGFSDQSHFTHRFTRHFGIAPAAYKRLTA